jgi:PLP dependent protein
MAAAARRSGREPESVTLLAVTKGFPVEVAREAFGLGLPDLGENRVQEAEGKIAAMGGGPRWHLIGHLQTNKARDAVALFDVIHSVDRLDLAREIDKRAHTAGRVVEALVEVNVAGEAQKGGVGPDDLAALLDAMGTLTAVRVRGLMAIPPAVERPDDARPWFSALRTLAERHGLKELSMGMSADFEIAIEEGATMVRVGTAIFGPRPAKAA